MHANGAPGRPAASRASGPPAATPATLATDAARGRLRGALVRLAEAHQKFAAGRCSRAAILLAENAVFYARAELIEAEVRGL